MSLLFHSANNTCSSAFRPSGCSLIILFTLLGTEKCEIKLPESLCMDSGRTEARVRQWETKWKRHLKGAMKTEKWREIMAVGEHILTALHDYTGDVTQFVGFSLFDWLKVSYICGDSSVSNKNQSTCVWNKESVLTTHRWLLFVFGLFLTLPSLSAKGLQCFSPLNRSFKAKRVWNYDFYLFF